MRNGPAIKPFQLVALSTVFVLVIATGVLVDVPSAPGSGSAKTLVYAVAASLASILAAGSAGQSLRSPAALRLAVIAATAFLIVANVDPASRPDAAAAGRLALVVFLFTVVTARATSRITTKLPGSTLIAVLVCAAWFLLPVWLAPLAVLFSDPGLVTDLIVALNPLSAFAVALDVDYLRLPWFYEHSVLGSLRYDYPAWPVYAGSFAALAGLLSLPDWRRGESRSAHTEQ